MLFANFAEAVAEGRGKAQAEPCAARDGNARPSSSSMTKTRQKSCTSSANSKPGDIVLVEAGELIPSDGEMIEGVASVNEAAITGESRP